MKRLLVPIYCFLLGGLSIGFYMGACYNAAHTRHIKTENVEVWVDEIGNVRSWYPHATNCIRMPGTNQTVTWSNVVIEDIQWWTNPTSKQ